MIRYEKQPIDPISASRALHRRQRRAIDGRNREIPCRKLYLIFWTHIQESRGIMSLRAASIKRRQATQCAVAHAIGKESSIVGQYISQTPRSDSEQRRFMLNHG